jgi:hypothetical protein
VSLILHDRSHHGGHLGPISDSHDMTTSMHAAVVGDSPDAMRRRHLTRLLTLTAISILVLIVAVIATAHQTSTQLRAHVAQPSGPTVELIHPGHLPARSANTFVSLVPACACGTHTDLSQFSLRDGRRLGTIATVKGVHPPSFQTSDPHPGPAGSFALTFTRGPLCKEPPGGGVSFGPCSPLPDSCTSIVDRVNAASGSVTALLNEPASTTVIDALPSPNGQELALYGGQCAPGPRFLTIRDLRLSRQWTIGADVPRCAGIGPATWSPNGSRLVFPYAPLIGKPPANPDFCTSTRLARIVIVPSDRSSISSSWAQIRADPRCGFMYAVFDPRGIAAVEGCMYGAPPGQGQAPQLGDAFLLQLARRDHRVVQRIPLAPGFDGGTVVTDPRSGAVLISEYQAANQGRPVFNWVWSYANGTLRLIRRYHENDAPEIGAEPW